MHLTKIEINGFKSFANKVTIDLSSGITCFVGPNGCGKSNIVDAIKWGIGEQRISTLRGDSMQDVIFKGNGSRAPMNFAEVSLYFSNTCKTLPVEYDEVVVTRRLFRTAESEYLLNRTPCRLKDIRALFYDTGIGVGAYSVMEQGRIDSILQADPVSRRAIFEEASGITRFKARRKEAERKLERTQTNLLRLGDIIEELERRIRSLKNQAGRARSYLKHTERLKALKRDHYLHEYQQYTEKAGILADERKETESELSRLTGLHSNQRETISSLEQEISLASEAVFDKKNQLTETKTALEETQDKTGYFEKSLGELENEFQEAVDRTARLEAMLQVKEKDFGDLQARHETLDREFQKIAVEKDRIAQNEMSAVKSCSDARQKLAGIESEMLSVTSRELAHKNKMVEAQAHFENTHKGFFRLAERQNVLASDIAEAARKLKSLDEEISRDEAVRDRLKSDLGESEKDARRVEEMLCQIDVDIREVESELIKRETRIEALQSLIARREGVGSGIKALLAEAGRDGSDLKFVQGMLGELIDVDVAHSAALEAALGITAEAVVVADLDQARRVIDFLENRSSGQVVLLPLSEFSGASSNHPAGNADLLQHVKCTDKALRRALEALLRDVRIIEKVQLTEQGVTRELYKAVTPEGDFVNRYGVLSIGGAESGSGVISRRSELAALDKGLEALRDQRHKLLEKRSEVVTKSETILKLNQDLFAKIETSNEGLASLTARREKRLERYTHLRREYALNAQDTRELEMNALELRMNLIELKQEKADLEETLKKLERALQEARQELEERREDQERQAESRRAVELQEIQYKERKEGIEKEKELLSKGLEEVRDQLDRMEDQKNRIDVTQADMKSRLENLKKRSAELLEKRSESSLDITAAEERLERLKAAFSRSQEEAETSGETIEATRRKIDEIRIEERENQVRCEGVLDKARDELHLDLTEIQFDDEDEPSDPNRDWDAVQKEIEEIKERLSRMGNVNIEAIHELEEVETRYDGLIDQKEDLVKSIKSLEDLIQSLNKVSREKFIETFQRVRSHFNDIFRKLFQGGKADVRLREGEDVLEAGIEVIAGPPGKDVRSISLLSGGERTLTAVGLLFALFKSRPSPFCILDEVDAALDEVNIERFCNLLGDFVQGSQFLIVTHSKRTMSFCDYLYGITMQEDGVTSYISLNLEAYEEPAA